jgi:uncharacterized membrane protein
MSKAKRTIPRSRPQRVWRTLSARPRLMLGAAVGIAVALLLPGDMRLATRMLIGWDVGVAVYLVLAYWLIARADVSHIRHHAAMEDEGRVAVLVFVSSAALASLGAIVALLSEAAGGSRAPAQLALAIATILLSWIFTHTMFALHYAYEYYAEDKERAAGLDFPGDSDPDYWDFIYFAFVVGTTAQTSDVDVTGRTVRRTVAAHGVISFLFNTALLALTVNIAANAVAGAPQ